MNTKIVPILITLSVILLGANLWLGLRSPSSGPQANRETSAVAPPLPVASPAPQPPAVVPKPVATEPAGPPPAPRSSGIKDFNAFADGGNSLEEKVAAFSRFMHGEDAHLAEVAAVRVSHLVKNADFTTHLVPLLQDVSLNPAAMEVLTLNMHSRPLEFMLPAWAAVTKIPNHPKRAAAREVLDFFLKDTSRLSEVELSAAITEFVYGHGK